MSTATGVPAAAEAGQRGPASWPGRLAGRLATWPPRAATVLAVLAWAAALAAIEPLVRGYLTSVPDQRMVDLAVYRTGGLSVLQGQPLYTVLTQPPQLLPFTYPPAAALFAVPLALLPWSAAQLAWVPFIYVPLAVVIWFAFAPLLRRVPSAGCARPPSRSSSRPALTCSRCATRCGSARWTWCCSRWPWRTARPARRAGRAACL